MSQVWVELRYGLNGQGVVVCRLDDLRLLKVLKRCALRRAAGLARESRQVDQVIHLQDSIELERLQRLLGLLIPEEDGG